MKDILLVAGLMVLPSSVSFRQQNATASINAGDPRLRRLEEFFAKRDCPLRAAAADFLIAADQNALDWRLLPSISMVESSGGKDYRNNNVFGWNSCRDRLLVGSRGHSFCCGATGPIQTLPSQESGYEAADL